MKARSRFNMKSFTDTEQVRAWKAQEWPKMERLMEKYAKQPVRGRTNV
jgi:hypothetical protein